MTDQDEAADAGEHNVTDWSARDIYEGLPKRTFGRAETAVLWASGVDRYVLARTAVDTTEFLIQGSGVLLTSFIGAVAGYLVAGTFGTPWYGQAAIAVVLALVVFTVDRMIVRSQLRTFVEKKNAQGKTILVGSTRWTVPFKIAFRLGIAVGLSFILVDAILIGIFRTEVDQRTTALLIRDMQTGIEQLRDQNTAMQAGFAERSAALATLQGRIDNFFAENPAPQSSRTVAANTAATEADAALASLKAEQTYYDQVSQVYAQCYDSEYNGRGQTFTFPTPPAGIPPESSCVTTTDAGDNGTDTVTYQEAEEKFADKRDELDGPVADAASAATAAHAELDAAKQEDETAWKNSGGNGAIVTLTTQHKTDSDSLQQATDLWNTYYTNETSRLQALPTSSPGYLTLRRALGELEHDANPETAANEPLPECQWPPVLNIGCTLWQWAFPATEIGQTAGLLRLVLVLIDLSPLFLKLIYVLRPRRPYDWAIANLEIYTDWRTRQEARTVKKLVRIPLVETVTLAQIRSNAKVAIAEAAESLRVEDELDRMRRARPPQANGSAHVGAPTGEPDDAAPSESEWVGPDNIGPDGSPEAPPADGYTVTDAWVDGGQGNHTRFRGVRARWETQDELSKPNNGRIVYLAVSEDMPGQFALKRFTNVSEAKFQHEMVPGFLGGTGSEFLVQYVDYGEQGDERFLVMPAYLRHKSVYEFWYENNGQFRLLSTVLTVAFNVLRGLEALARHGLAHRDVKPPNILVNDDAQGFLLCDYGLSRPSGTTRHMTTNGEVTNWFAPYEQQNREIAASNSLVDIRALGATMYWLLTLQPPLVRESRSRKFSRQVLGIRAPLLGADSLVVGNDYRSVRAYDTLLRTVHPLPVDRLDPTIPSSVSDLISTWLHPDPLQRVTQVAVSQPEIIQIAQQHLRTVIEDVRSLGATNIRVANEALSTQPLPDDDPKALPAGRSL